MLMSPFGENAVKNGISVYMVLQSKSESQIFEFIYYMDSYKFRQIDVNSEIPAKGNCLY